MDERQYERALELLLDAWRVQRGSALADLIDHVSRRAAEGLPSLRRKPLAAQWKEWLLVAQQKRPVDFERLTDVPLPRKPADARALLDKLYQRGPDPRFSRFARALSELKVVYEERSDRGQGDLHSFNGMLRDRCLELGDRRALPLLLREAREPLSERLIALRDTAEPSGESLELVKAMSARFSSGAGSSRETSQSADELLEQIFVRPDDVGLRAVYGDALTQLGDPRGEFIALELSGARQSPQQVKLLKRFSQVWSGPLDAFFEKDKRRFEGGFLSGGELSDFSFQPTPDVMALREWKLFTSLILPYRLGTALLLHPNLARVRDVEVTGAIQLPELLEREWAFSRLMVRGQKGFDLRSLRAAQCCPQLQVLGLRLETEALALEALQWVRSAPVLERIRQFEVANVTRVPGAWWMAIDASPVPSLLFGPDFFWTFAFERDARGRLGALRCAMTPHSSTGLAQKQLESMLAALPPDSLTSFSLPKTPGHKRLDRQRIDGLLARFEKLSEVELPWS